MKCHNRKLKKIHELNRKFMLVILFIFASYMSVLLFERNFFLSDFPTDSK